MKVAFLSLIVVFLAIPAHAGPYWLDRAMRDIGTNPTGWSSRWCGRYIDMRVPGKWSNKAIANRNHGRPSTCRRGAIAVMNGHIGIVVNCSGQSCKVLSGNGRGRKVDVKNYKRSRIVACRWPHP